MTFNLETSRVDCISKNITLISVYEKLHLSHLKHPPIPPLFSARKIFRARSTLMHLVYVNNNIFFSYIQVDNTLIILPWTVLNS